MWVIVKIKNKKIIIVMAIVKTLIILTAIILKIFLKNQCL
jgi:hypothetical protein